jgi:hypothetical protein
VVGWWPVVTVVRAGGLIAARAPCGWLERLLAPQLAGRAGGWEGGGGGVVTVDDLWRRFPVRVCVWGARVCAAAWRLDCGAAAVAASARVALAGPWWAGKPLVRGRVRGCGVPH